jgi:hypothetical protein
MTQKRIAVNARAPPLSSSPKISSRDSVDAPGLLSAHPTSILVVRAQGGTTLDRDRTRRRKVNSWYIFTSSESIGVVQHVLIC